MSRLMSSCTEYASDHKLNPKGFLGSLSGGRLQPHSLKNGTENGAW